jgi:hypothetical protein
VPIDALVQQEFMVEYAQFFEQARDKGAKMHSHSQTARSTWLEKPALNDTDRHTL